MMGEIRYFVLTLSLALAAVSSGIPVAAATGDGLPWCVYDDPALYRDQRRSGNVTCPEPKSGVQLPDSLYLPLPCGHWLAFRKVRIPIGGLLSDPQKTFGYAMPKAEDELAAYRSALFGPRNVRVSGGFSEDADGRPIQRAYEDLRFRSYYIARYETTELQFALFTDGLFDKPEASDPGHPVCNDAIARKHATRGRVKPATGVDVFSALRFVEVVNRWIFSIDHDRARRGLPPWMPWELGSPGFVRLPSEAEWELAAWGGPQFAPEGPPTRRLHIALENGELVDVGEDTRRIAVIGSERRRTRVRAVGRRLPNPLGLYDMVGNVEELVWDLFVPVRPDRTVAGQRGGLVARGGAYDTPEAELAVGRRIEVPLYSSNGPGRTPTLGFRLAVSAPFLSRGGRWNDPGKYNTELLKELQEARDRFGAATGSEDQDRAARIQERIRRLTEQLETMERSKTELRMAFAEQLQEVEAEAEQLRFRLAEAERARVAERVKAGIMLTKSIREFGGVALTIVKGVERLAEKIRAMPSDDRETYRSRLVKLCEELGVREWQMGNQYDMLLTWVDDLARSDKTIVRAGFDKVLDELRVKRLSVYDDAADLFRSMISEARRHGSVTGNMRRRYLNEIDISRERRSQTACTREL